MGRSCVGCAAFKIRRNLKKDKEPCPVDSYIPRCPFTVIPISYDMSDGYKKGSSDFSDNSYNGENIGPACYEYPTIINGLGDLRDGVVATQQWNLETPLYVGWRLDGQFNSVSMAVANGPVNIVFKVGPNEIVGEVKISVDDPPGFFGGVGRPSFVEIDEIPYPFPPNPNGEQMGPYTATIVLQTPIVGADLLDNELSIQLFPFYKTDAPGTLPMTDCNVCTASCVAGSRPPGFTGTVYDCAPWVFVSEVELVAKCPSRFFDCVAEGRCQCAREAKSCAGRTLEERSSSGRSTIQGGKDNETNEEPVTIDSAAATSLGSNSRGPRGRRGTAYTSLPRKLEPANGGLKAPKDTCGKGNGSTLEPEDVLCIDDCYIYVEERCVLEEKFNLLQDCPIE
jgi:hypothetical protein